MPYYIFAHPKTKEVVEIFQHMKDEHVYCQDGIEYERVYTNSQLATNGIGVKDDFNVNQFKEKTRGKDATIGSVMELSQELSESRASRHGVDPLKQKFYDRYSKKRNGLQHPDLVKAKEAADLKKLGITVIPDKKHVGRPKI